jgi:hypothetical protein
MGFVDLFPTKPCQKFGEDSKYVNTRASLRGNARGRLSSGADYRVGLVASRSSALSRGLPNIAKRNGRASRAGKWSPRCFAIAGLINARHHLSV